jgi:hypothetical protein
MLRPGDSTPVRHCAQAYGAALETQAPRRDYGVRMETVDEYMARAAEAEAHATRCMQGSSQQREFSEIAAQWRALALQRERAVTRKAPPDKGGQD